MSDHIIGVGNMLALLAQMRYNLGYRNETRPLTACNSRRALTTTAKELAVSAIDQSYHIPYPLNNSTEIERIVAWARTICADLTRIQFFTPYELRAMSRLYGVAANTVNVVTPTELDMLYLAADAASDELVRRDRLCTGAHLPEIMGFVYLLRTSLDYYKIGCTTKPRNRLLTFGIQLPFEVELVCLIYTRDIYHMERELHSRFREQRERGEWFKLSADDVDYIKGLAR